MKMSVRIVQVLDLDADSIELTCNSLVTKKPMMERIMDKAQSLDLVSMRDDMVQSMPKMFKVVVDRRFYEKNNINIGSIVNIEVSI